MFACLFTNFCYTNLMKICIICETKIDPEKLIEKHEVNFCSEECLAKYEEKLKELDKVIDWDKCC